MDHRERVPPRAAARRIAILAVLVAASLASLATSPPAPPSVGSSTSFRVTVSPDDPLVLRDIVVTADTSVLGAGGGRGSIVLELGWDPRVRVVRLADGRLPLQMRTSEQLFSFPADGCDQDGPCSQQVRLAFELLDDAAPVTIEGSLRSSFAWSETETWDPAAVTLTGLDAGPSQPAPVSTESRIEGPPVLLDDDHPVEVHVVRARIDPRGVADPELLMPDLHIWTEGDDPATGRLAVRTERLSDPQDQGSSGSLGRRGGSPSQDLPLRTADCVPGAVCDETYRVTFSWKGDTGSSRRIRWGLSAGAVDYARRPARAPTVEASYVEGWSVPDDAPRLTRTFSGELTLDSRGDALGAGGMLTVRLSPEAVQGPAAAGRIPAHVAFSWSATEADGASTGEPAIRMLMQNSWVEMFAADGRAWSINLDLLESCEPGVACEVHDFPRIFVPDGASRVDLPVVIRWRAVVEVTSFSSEPFDPGADISLTLEERW